VLGLSGSGARVSHASEGDHGGGVLMKRLLATLRARARRSYRAFWMVAVPALACSRLVNVEPAQCSSRADCSSFGAEYACVAGLCEEASAGAGGEIASDRHGGAAGDADAGSVGSGGSEGVGEAGSRAHGGAAGDGGAGDGGQSGAPVIDEPACTSHKQCFDRHGDDEPFACVDGHCVALKSPDCPRVLPVKDTEYDALKSSDAIVLGAFGHVLPASNELNNSSQNYDLALTELMEETSGIPAAGGRRRQVVVVVCHNDYPTQDELLAPALHLMRDLRVPGIIATLKADDMQYVFEEVGLGHGTFFMGPLAPDQNLLDHGDDGLMWHMLSGPRALSVTYRPLLDLTITHLRNLGVVAAEEEVRVALVTSTQERALGDIGTAIREGIRFNGRTSAENSPENFLAVSTSSLDTDGTQDASRVARAILTLKPHVIISAAAAELVRIIPILEALWEEDTQGQARPFYLLSPHQYTNPALVTEIERQQSLGPDPLIHRRMAGVNWAAAADRTVYEEYARELTTNYANVELPVSGENFYDAAYYLLYATAAAGSPLSGRSISRGMERLMSGSQSFDMGRRDLDAALTTLYARSTNEIQLIGSMGPPAFDLAGGRSEPGSVYCINAALEYMPDHVRYDPDSGLLTGTFPCWAFPARAPK
jgi:hypothetical protein